MVGRCWYLLVDEQSLIMCCLPDDSNTHPTLPDSMSGEKFLRPSVHFYPMRIENPKPPSGEIDVAIDPLQAAVMAQ